MFFTETQQIFKYTGNIQVDMEFEVLKPYLDRAESKYIVGLLGEVYYQSLGEKIQQGTLGADDQEVVNRVQHALAYYMLYLSFPFLNINLTDLGFTQPIGDRFQRASQASTDLARAESLRVANEAADKLLEFLEDNREKYPEWLPSAGDYLIINSARQMTCFVPMVGNSSQNYKRIKAFIQTAEDNHIAETISEEYLAHLKESRSNLAPDDKIAWTLAEKALANFAMFEALPFLEFKIESGVMLFVTDDNKSQKKQKIPERDRAQMADAYQRNGKKYLDKLRNLLINSSDEQYPVFKASGVYTPPPNISLDLPTHDGESGSFTIY